MDSNKKAKSSEPMVLTLLKTFTLILLLTAFVILYVLATTLTQHAKTKLEYDLNLVGGMIQEVIEREETNLGNAANVLARDFGFRSAVATNDSPTIESVLANHSQRVKADLALLMTLEGSLIAANKNLPRQPSEILKKELIERSVVEDNSTAFIVWNNTLYIATLIPIRAPTPVAVTLFGFKIDERFLEPLNAVTGLQIRLDAIRPEESDLVVSTSNANVQCTHPSHLTSYATMIFADKSACISDEFVLIEQEYIKVKVTVFDRLENLFSDFYHLQISIIITIIVAMGLSLLLTALSARKITAPLARLVDKSRVASKGDYSHLSFDGSVSKEVEQLRTSFNEMIDAIKMREAEIRYQADHDTLSDSFNRRKIESVFEQKRIAKDEFSVVAINIIGLRSFNDTFGYQYGDLVIGEIASRLMKQDGDVARLDGGVFLLLSRGKYHNDQLEIFLTSLEQDVHIEESEIPVSISAVHLRCPQDATDFNTLIQRVNIVMDEARSTKTRLLLFHPSFEKTYLRKLQIVAELKQALVSPDEQFKMVYQPKYHNDKKQISGAEALIRWINPNLGFVPPDEFIGIAEQADLIGDITHWVLNRVAQDTATMRQRQIAISVAINLSTRDLNDETLFDTIESLHQKHSLPMGTLSFEVTESDLVSNPELAKSNLEKLRNAQMDIAIDDFGTGYSSLSYLKTLPINILKIDKCFVLKLASDTGDQHIVKTTLLLAKSLGLKTVAEGVEDQNALAMLSEWGCTWCQGYFISKPMDLLAFIDWFAEHEKTIYH